MKQRQYSLIYDDENGSVVESGYTYHKAVERAKYVSHSTTVHILEKTTVIENEVECSFTKVVRIYRRGVQVKPLVKHTKENSQ